MGKKKKKTTEVITTVETKVIKLTYLQTLAISNQLASAQDLETGAQEGEFAQVSGDSDGPSPLAFVPGFGIGLFGKKKKSVSVKTDTSGLQVKDQWLQPYFNRIRYGIGIRELTAAAYTFDQKSEFVSVPFVSPKEIIKVHCLVDEYIPPQFDQNQAWLEYFIRVEGEENFIRINPLNAPTRFDEAGEIIPKIINFNLPKPTTAQLEDKFNTTEEPVKKIRFKAVLTRPTDGDSENITPLLKSYRLVMTPRQ